MSMTSSQFDSVRRVAQTYRDIGMYEVEQMYLDVVVGIQRLLDDYQQANAENAKLRDEVERLRSVVSDGADNAREVLAENAKLRELVADAPKCEACEAMLDCDECLRADVSHKEHRRLSFENAKLRESLEKAAGIITDICGECPVSRYEWLSSDGCAEKCGAVTEEECWTAYLTSKRWDESGAEVD